METLTAGYNLIDAVEHQRQHSAFELPDEGNRSHIQPGEWAKLMFCIPDHNEILAERMWVRVTEVTNPGYIGLLDNEPDHLHSIKVGTIIRFEARHVISIWPPGMYFEPLTLK